jgi:hypothetical protein
MKDPGFEIRKAYFEALNGNVILNGKSVPVYDGTQTDAMFPYIILGTQTNPEGVGAKVCYNTDSTIELDIVTGYLGDSGGKKDSDDIANQVKQLIYPDIELDNGFQALDVSVDNDITLGPEMSGSHKIFRRLIRFRHNIFQE